MMRALRWFGTAFVCAIPVALHAQLPKPLIPQGSFEGTLDGWEVGYGKVELDAQQAHGGKGSVRLTNGSALETGLIPYSQQFVHISLWMRTESVQRGAQAWNEAGGQVSWFGADKQEIGHSDIGLTVGTTDWTQHEASYFREAKEQVAYFRVRLMIWDAQGTAWFDDVVVEEAGPPEAFRKVPLLSEVEDSPPRFWALPELQPVPGPIDVGTMEVSFTPDRDFLIRPADKNAPEITRLDARISSAEPLGFKEGGLESAAGYYYRYRLRAESRTGYPAMEVYSEAFRDSPILSQFIRVYLANGTTLARLEAGFKIPPSLTRLSYFWGNRLQTSALGEKSPVYRFGLTTKPFVILHTPDDTAGIVIYHPIPAEVRRWYIEDYLVESRPDIVCRPLKQEDGSYRLSWDFRDLVAGPGGYEHSFDFTVFLMPYAGTMKGALGEFQVGDVDLTEPKPPLPEAAKDGYWAEWMGLGAGERILRMARYYPREFSSWIPGTSGGCYGHRDGHMWGGTNQQMKGIRVDPLAERALPRDHAIRMLHFFVERGNEHGAPPEMSMWRDLAARLENPEDYRTHVFCQFWEFRMGEFRRLMQSPHLTDSEKGEVYLALQRAQKVFDPNAPGSWTKLTPDGGYWFDYMDLPIWDENPWVINTHTTSLGVAGQFRLLAQEMHQDADAQWWGEVFKRGVDGLLYALGQDWMWYADAHDPNELRYAAKLGGPRGYHSYMVTAWMPDVIRSAIALDNYRVDELVTYYQRMMKAKYLEGDEEVLKPADEFLRSIGRGGA